MKKNILFFNLNFRKRTVNIILVYVKKHISVKQLEAPTKTSTVYDDEKYACMFENECNKMDAEVVTGFVSNVKTFLKVC